LSIPERRKANANSGRGILRIEQRGGERNAGLPFNHCASMSPVIFCETKSICFRQAAGRARMGSFNFFMREVPKAALLAAIKVQQNFRKISGNPGSATGTLR
jgi:hypothetical protein